MLKGLWLCLKRFPKPELITFASCLGLIYVLWNCTTTYIQRNLIETYDHVDTVSEESLEIVLCPMPRVYALRLLRFGHVLPNYLHWREFYDLYKPAIKNVIQKDPNFKDRDGTQLERCFWEKRLYKPTRDPLDLFEAFYDSRCELTRDIAEESKDALIDMIQAFKSEEYLTNMFETLDERFVDEYPALYEQAWVLQHENISLSDMMDFMAVNLTKHLDEQALVKSVLDEAGPSHQFYATSLSTRMAPMCFRHVLKNSGQGGHQRSTITYPFYKDRCPKETPSTVNLEHTPCLKTTNMYLTIYVTAINEFTDVPAASTIVPYRIPMDQQTLLHISVQKKRRLENCKIYPSNFSSVMCIESCMFENLLEEINCTLPWIKRLHQRYKPSMFLPECKDQKELNDTIRMVHHVFEEQTTTPCIAKCPPSCDELTITPELAGSTLITDEMKERQPRLQLYISGYLPVFTDIIAYDFGRLVAEVMGNLSFLVGVSLVALYDWLIGVSLWVVGKLPFIPAMPPLIKSELYMEEICSCAETDEERRQSAALHEFDTSFLAESFKHHGGRHRNALTFQDEEEAFQQSPRRGRRRAVTFPALEMRTSALDTMLRTLATIDDQGRRQSSFLEMTYSQDGSQMRLPLFHAGHRRKGSVSRGRRPTIERSSQATLNRGSSGTVKTKPSRLVPMKIDYSVGMVPASRAGSGIVAKPSRASPSKMDTLEEAAASTARPDAALPVQEEAAGPRLPVIAPKGQSREGVGIAEMAEVLGQQQTIVSAVTSSKKKKKKHKKDRKSNAIEPERAPEEKEEGTGLPRLPSLGPKEYSRVSLDVEELSVRLSNLLEESQTAVTPVNPPKKKKHKKPRAVGDAEPEQTRVENSEPPPGGLDAEAGEPQAPITEEKTRKKKAKKKGKSQKRVAPTDEPNASSVLDAAPLPPDITDE